MNTSTKRNSAELLERMLYKSSNPLRTAVIVSGSGSSFEAFVDKTTSRGLHTETGVEYKELYGYEPKLLIITRDMNVGEGESFAVERARRLGIPYTEIEYDRGSDIPSSKDLDAIKHLEDTLILNGIDFMACLGCTKMIPESVIDYFGPNIVNMHPVNKEKYGGRGMYGLATHRAVLEARDTQTQIHCHYVNPKYDQGADVIPPRIISIPSELMVPQGVGVTDEHAQTLQKLVLPEEYEHLKNALMTNWDEFHQRAQVMRELRSSQLL